MAAMPPPARVAFALTAQVILLVACTRADPSTDATCAEDAALSRAAVSALQQSVGGHDSQLSVAEHTSNFVDSLTSHVQALAEATQDRSLTLEQVTKQNDNILAALHALRGSEDNGTSHLSNIDKKSLEGILDVLTKTMFGNLDKLHNEDQAEVNSAHAAVVKCNTDRQATLSGSVATASLSTQAAREMHLRGRANESALSTTNSSKWSDYENLITTIKAPSCPTFTPTLTAMDVFFSSNDNSYIKWYLAMQAEYIAKKGSFERTKGTLLSKKAQADGLQRSFENQYCEYMGHQIDMCSTHGACHAGALASYKAAVNRVRQSEASRKSYLKSGHAVICHVKAILGKDNKTHSQCEQDLAGVDTAKLDMLFPSVPAADQCDVTAAAASQPCDSTFRTAEYGGLPSDVHPTTCSRCTWESPTPSPSPTTGVLNSS
mmetsp:Transcript_91053/g.283699  ORF Transcript_91053/g.283699 Transcript_91053/m.283699 type:complete len:433 (-) Transcript_91053:612-1910(-)